jgi:hypothetical protein
MLGFAQKQWALSRSLLTAKSQLVDGFSVERRAAPPPIFKMPKIFNRGHHKGKVRAEAVGAL